MKKIVTFGCLLLLFVMQATSWGFYGHKVINRLAVFTLPESLLGFYKANIEYVTEHAPDPDKRRYTDKEEACRHYTDLDHYEQQVPVDTVPKYWKDAVAKYSEDTLKAYGIVAWHINVMKARLTEAFKEKDRDKILHLSADIGHYIGDAHVPLHSTENYNGQLTGQNGIHAFWESRLPELYAKDYDFFVGRAVYIDDVQAAVWNALAGSFAAKDSVLAMERTLNTQFAPDRKYTYEDKSGKQVKNYSLAYAEAYNKMLAGQVERRMRAAVKLVGSLWYTCWVDAGQPDLAELAAASPKTGDKERKKEIATEQQQLNEKMLGREE